jgi:hypothetical protein
MSAWSRLAGWQRGVIWMLVLAVGVLAFVLYSVERPGASRDTAAPASPAPVVPALLGAADPPAQRAPYVEPVATTALSICREYRENAIGADRKYRAADFIIGGTVATVQRAASGVPVVVLDGSVPDAPCPVLLYVFPAREDDLLALRPGSFFRANCSVRSGPSRTGNLELVGCVPDPY